MSDPNPNTEPEHSTIQEQVQPVPSEQPEPQLFYNEETGEWYDSFGRVYNQEGENNQQEQVYDQYESNIENYQQQPLEEEPANIQGTQAILQQDDGERNQLQVGQNKEEVQQQQEQIGQNSPDIEIQQSQKNQQEPEKEPEQIQVQIQPERQPICLGLPEEPTDDNKNKQEQIQKYETKKPEEETEIKQNQPTPVILTEQEKQQKERQASIAREKQQEERKEKEREKEREIQREKERERERERQKQRQRERQRQKQRQIQRQKERQFIKEKERLIEKQEKLTQQKEKLIQEEKQNQERIKEQHQQEKRSSISQSPEKSEGKKNKKDKKQKKQKKQKKSKKQKENKDKSNENPVPPVVSKQGNQQSNNQTELKSLKSPPAQGEPLPPNLPDSPVVPPPGPQVVEIQPIMIIRQAQKERIQSTLNMFAAYISKHGVHIGSQKSVYINMTHEIERKKGEKYAWFHFIKEYFSQYQSLTRTFHETSYKGKKEQRGTNTNIYLNVAEELKTGIDELLFLKKQTGNNYNRFNEYIGSKINAELEIAFNKFISELNKAQYDCSEKKKRCMTLEELYKNNVERLTKIYNRGRLGKKQDEDVFVETCKFIQTQRQYRQSLILWGKGIIELRRIFVGLDLRLNEEIQVVLNIFKNAQANIYGFHPQKFETIINSKQEILKQTKYSRLGGMADADYIKYALELLKIPVTEISDKDFQYFVQMPHFEIVVGKSTDLLKGMINKSFQLRDKNEELINTISGNLVHFNRESSEYKEKFIIKNLMANIVADGVIQFDEVLPGIIFNNNRTIRLSFKDQDRAEELICLLNQKI